MEGVFLLRLNDRLVDDGLRKQQSTEILIVIDDFLDFYNTERELKAHLNPGRAPWYSYTVYTLMAIFIQLALGWDYAFPDGRDEEGIACFTIPEKTGRSQNYIMCELEESLQWGHAQLRILAAFVLGGYIANTVMLWRERRTNYCALCGACRNLIIQIGTMVPGDDKPPKRGSSHSKSKSFATKKEGGHGGSRALMERWCMLGYEIAILKCQGLMDTEEGKLHLESLGLLDKNEWESMVEGDRHTSAWYWIQRKATELTDEGIIPSEHRLQTICQAVTLIRDKANDIMSCINRDHPTAYTAAVGMVIQYSLITMVMWKGVEWSIWFYETEGLVWIEPRMYSEAMLMLAFSGLLAALFDMDQILYNPFACREGLDIPHGLVASGIRNLARRIGAAEKCYPPPAGSGIASNGISMARVGHSERHIAFERDQVRGNARGSLLSPFTRGPVPVANESGGGETRRISGRMGSILNPMNKSTRRNFGQSFQLALGGVGTGVLGNRRVSGARTSGARVSTRISGYSGGSSERSGDYPVSEQSSGGFRFSERISDYNTRGSTTSSDYMGNRQYGGDSSEFMVDKELSTGSISDYMSGHIISRVEEHEEGEEDDSSDDKCSRDDDEGRDEVFSDFHSTSLPSRVMEVLVEEETASDGGGSHSDVVTDHIPSTESENLSEEHAKSPHSDVVTNGTRLPAPVVEDASDEDEEE